jgi:peptidoglycan DL-endopeptidase CwlO
MALRLTALLALASVACSVTAASAAHAKRAAPAAVHLPALRQQDETATGRCPIPQPFRPAFARAARDTGLQLSMLVAVAQVESEFKPNAVSRVGARGLMQVVPTTAAELNLNIDRPESNVLAGARYLRQMVSRFSRVDLALAAYNAGPTLVDRLGGAPNAEAAAYVGNVQRRWAALAGCS